MSENKNIFLQIDTSAGARTDFRKGVMCIHHILLVENGYLALLENMVRKERQMVDGLSEI